MKTVEIKELSVKEIKERLDAEKGNMVKMKMNHAVSPLDNPQNIKVVRRNIARMLTVLKQKEENI